MGTLTIAPSGREVHVDPFTLRRRREPFDALGPAPRAELLHVLMLPDFERADRIGEFWSYPESRAVAELLIDGSTVGPVVSIGVGAWCL